AAARSAHSASTLHVPALTPPPDLPPFPTRRSSDLPLAALGRHVGHHDLRALSRECLGVLLADAAGCAGHDRGLPVETSHVAAPPTSSPAVGWVCCACRASGRGGHGLDLEVLLEALAAHLAADAGLLVAAERDVGAVPLAAVDAERAGADPCDDLLDALGIGAPHGAGQAVGGVVGDPDR